MISQSQKDIAALRVHEWTPPVDDSSTPATLFGLNRSQPLRRQWRRRSLASRVAVFARRAWSALVVVWAETYFE